MKIKEYFVSKQFKFGAFATVLTALFIAVVLLINMFISVLDEHTSLSLDLTSNDLFKLSDTSVEYIKTIDTPVEIVLMFDADEMRYSGNYYLQIVSVIESYSNYSNYITITDVDPEKDPTFAAKYPDYDLEYGDILVISEYGTKQLALVDLLNLEYDSSSGATYIVSSKAEQEMTSAVMDVLDPDKKQITFLTGHGETIPTEFKSLIELNGYLVTETNILVEDISADVDIAIMAGPTLDFDETGVEAEKLTAFLYNDGEYSKALYYAPPSFEYSTPNIFTFLKQWGIEYGDSMVYEGNSAQVMYNLPYLTFCEYGANSSGNNTYYSNMTQASPVMMPTSREMTRVFEQRDYYSTSVYLQFSATSYVAPIDADENWTYTADDLAARPAMIESLWYEYEQSTPKISRVLAFASNDFWGDDFITLQTIGNSEFLISTVNTLTQKSAGIFIESKNLDFSSITVNTLQVFIIGGFFTLAVPVLLVGTGVTIWFKRKNK